MGLSAKVIIAVAAIVFAAGAGLVASFVVSVSGRGGEHSDPRSYQALQAKGFDEMLKPGMTRSQIENVYDLLRSRAGGETIRRTCDPGCEVAPREMDWIIVEPRPYTWSSFDTLWQVSAILDRDGRLVRHTVEHVECCGP